MKCSLQDCSGQYEERYVVHPVRHLGKIVVIDHVPAEVCCACGDVLLTPEVVRRIERLLAEMPEPAGAAPLYEFA
jgi:YgiT-type zinc finger domain-containing protein